MRRFFDRLIGGCRRWMMGRYGMDELSRFLLFLELIFLLLSLIPMLWFFYWGAILLLFWSLFRMMSKNFPARQKERTVYLNLRDSHKKKWKLQANKFRDRKTHRYLRCPSCHAVVRIKKPGRHKKITVTCPRCRQIFEKRTLK